MNKIWKRFGILLFAALFLACSINLPVRAEEGGSQPTGGGEGLSGPAYTYTVRIYAGKQGTIAGAEMKPYYDVAPGGTIDFDKNDVVLNEGSDKYYVKGIRESGKDNSELYVLNNGSITVDRDVDYVVAYGLKGNLVEYTVRFVDAETEEKLAEDQTYYGSVGDKPVVSYLYIEGYQPRSYNITKTLVADPSENVFTFKYTPFDGTQVDETVTMLPGTETLVTEVIPGTGGGANAGTTVVADANADAAAGGAAAGGGAADGGAGDGGVVIDEPQVPLDTIDLDTMDEDGTYLDEPTVPLSDMKFKLGPIEMDARRLAVTFAVLAAVATIAIASFLYWRPRRKKEKTDEEDATRSV